MSDLRRQLNTARTHLDGRCGSRRSPASCVWPKKILLRFWRSWIQKMKAPGRDVVLLKQFGECANVRYQVEWYVEYIQVFNRI